MKLRCSTNALLLDEYGQYCMWKNKEEKEEAQEEEEEEEEEDLLMYFVAMGERRRSLNERC